MVGAKPANIKFSIMSNKKVNIFSNKEKAKTLGKINDKQLEEAMQSVRNIIKENANHYQKTSYYIIIDEKTNYVSNDTYKKVRQYIEGLV